MLLAAGCGSAGIRGAPAGEVEIEAASRLLGEVSHGGAALRVWVDTSLIHPYRVYAIEFQDESAEVESFDWWPYSSSDERRAAQEFMDGECAGRVSKRARVLLCRTGELAPATDQLASEARQLAGELHEMELPATFGEMESNSDGTITFASDGTIIYVQLPPFDARSTATFEQPEDPAVCHSPLCARIARLVMNLQQ